MWHTIKAKAETFVRAILTIVVLFNAVIPTTALAMPPSSAEESSVQLEPHKNDFFQSSESKGVSVGANVFFSDNVKDDPSLAQPAYTYYPSRFLAQTSIPSPTPSSTESESSIQFGFSASPAQANPGDEVIFTITITNNDKTEITGLMFSNLLPEQLREPKSENNDFKFDPKTNILTWTSDSKKGNGAAILPGETITLQYTATIDSQIDKDLQVVDEADLFMDGMVSPLTAALELGIFPQGKKKEFTSLGSQGGKAEGIEGHVFINIPAGELSGTDGVLIEDLGKSFQSDLSAPSLVFQLDVVGETPAPNFGSQEQDTVTSLDPKESKFEKPVEITVSFDGILDLSELGAEYAPYLVTLDESSGVWVRVPLKLVDRDNNTITAETVHFSTWGAGVGSSFPQNGANVLLFDSAYPGLFTGRSNYSFPIWTPPGRNGMAPSLALSYSGGTADGVLGDVQASWVGMGWNVDSVEIARKITSGGCSPCVSGSYGYENNFLLLFNGTGYELVRNGTTPGRFHTKSESFLYIQRHNDSLGNNSPTAQNATGEWWEVVEKDGTRWRLGWNTDSEQLAAMKGYPGAASGAWAALGYGGHATDVAASRWRADQVTDVYGNGMSFTYTEESRAVAGTTTNYDRASYVNTISYTSHTSGSPAAGYSVAFVLENRGTNDVPVYSTEWDDWDTSRLDRIDVKYGSTVVRTYDLSYQVRSYSDGGANWQTTVLTSMTVSGLGTTDPPVTFTYADKDNRAANGSNSNEWAYPRLATINNGWGGVSTYTYDNDGRPYTSWYNWRVTTLDVNDGVNTSPIKTTFAYSAPCYDDSAAGWCNAGNSGGLIGYAQTTATNLAFDGATILAKTIHKFLTIKEAPGREYETQDQDASSTTLQKTYTQYTIMDSSGYPNGAYYTYASGVDEFVYATGLIQVSHSLYSYDQYTGNLMNEWQYYGTNALFRMTEYEYVTNTSAWILNTVSRRTLKDANGAILSQQEYGYNGNLPGVGSPATNKSDLSRVVNGAQTIDTKYVYDAYGNVTDTRLYKNYGATSSQPSGPYLTYSTGYDPAVQTYAISKGTPLIPATLIGYNYNKGLPTSVTDPNGNQTTTTYDGLGRVASVTYPGYAQPNVKYTYPTAPISAPFAVKMELWDEPASVYRSAWQMLDGLGRVIQTQGPYETAGTLILTDTSYNALGLTKYSGLPRTLSGTGGTYFAPTWTSIPHTTTSYDALGRTTSAAYPDNSSETFSYSGLRTTAIDRNSHQKVQENDAFGRLIKVEEYAGANPYTLYATTTYEYDPRDLLKKVTDAVGNQTSISYNGFGRKTSMTDPDLGAWSYGYSVLGNLTTQTDARNCVTTITYDDLNRPTQKTYTGAGACNGTPDVTYTYDATAGGNEGLGRRTGLSNSNSTTAWVYNVLGQATSETHTIVGGSTNYTAGAAFDAFSRPLTQTLPNGETLNYTYNAMGALSSLSGTSTYVSQIHYAASGQVTDQLLGNGLLQQSCYNANTLRLTGLRVYSGSLQSCIATPSSPRLNLSYTYQPNGNVSQLTDATRSETLNYTYDELDRLDTVSGAYSQNHDYNLIGNITTKGSAAYTYGNSAHKHAATSLSSGESYTYDPNGNMITRVEGGLTYTQTFDAENRLKSVIVSGQTTTFLYDGDGNLVKKIKPDGSKTIYIGGVYEVDKTSGGSTTRTVTYYPAAGAMRIDSTLYYILKDHLGSASVVTDASGNILGENRYSPYGETRLTTGTILTDKLFTGQREIAGLGIYHYGARFYSPKLGRFLSADTIVPGYANPQNLNRYSYVLNNPIRYNDPTGHMCSDPEDPTPSCDGSGGGGGGGDGGGGGNGGGNSEEEEEDEGGTYTPTPIPTSTPTPCTGPYLACVPTATNTLTLTPTPYYPFGQGPAAQTAVNGGVSVALTVNSAVIENCGEAGSCGQDFVQPIVSGNTSKYPFIGFVIDATIAIGNGVGLVGDSIENGVIDMGEGWQAATPIQRTGAVVVVIAIAIVVPGFIPP